MSGTSNQTALFILGMLLLAMDPSWAQVELSFIRQDFQVGDAPFAVTVGDFNGDGRQDLAATDRLGSVFILLGRGDGTFETAQDFAVGRGEPLSITVGDFNSDGRQDLATAGGSTNFGNLSILLGRGDATFDASTVDPATVSFGATGGEAAPVHWALEDVDADGNTDLILHFRTQATGIGCGDTSASVEEIPWADRRSKGRIPSERWRANREPGEAITSLVLALPDKETDWLVEARK